MPRAVHWTEYSGPLFAPMLDGGTVAENVFVDAMDLDAFCQATQQPLPPVVLAARAELDGTYKPDPDTPVFLDGLQEARTMSGRS